MTPMVFDLRSCGCKPPALREERVDAGHLLVTLHCQVDEDAVEQRGAVDADTGAWAREISTPAPQGEREPC